MKLYLSAVLLIGLAGAGPAAAQTGNSSKLAPQAQAKNSSQLAIQARPRNSSLSPYPVGTKNSSLSANPAQFPRKEDRGLGQKLDEVMASGFNKDGLGGVLLVAKHDTIIYENAVGKANMELDIPLSTTNVFRVGSITKQFTAVAILQLMEKGQLQLDDDITRFIPEYPNHGNHISVANLLSHTSGIRNYTGIPGSNPDVRRRKVSATDIIALFKDQPMEFAPGTAYKYSNSNYIVLGYIIEKLSGQTYEQYLQDHIFKPFGMAHSCVDSPERIIPGRVTGYVQKGGNMVVNADYLDPSFAFAAGALATTAEDLFKWHLGLRRYTILNKESLTKALTPFTLKDGQQIKYGFGWALDSLDGSAAIQHGGSINGFSAYELYLPKEEIFVACLSNGANINTEGPAALAAAIAAGKPAIQEIQLSEEQMACYTGHYKFKLDQPSVTTIFEKDHKLYLQNPGAPLPWQMHFTKPTEFYLYEVFPNNHVFSFDGSGKVTAYVVHAPNYTSTITRVE
jgi:CubicO group peptidase (beta-lactamase class C family)